ncbi:hypothetical protein OC835_000139 [Tilletia horrida]|nr:hypothetical protein OC835_000139 [Tilletia horrida]
MSIKWPPDHFEWVPGQPGKRVRCTICADSAKSTTGFNRSTAAAHINTARHKKAEDIVKHLHNVCLPSSSDVEDEFRAEDRSHLSSPIPLYQPMHLFIDDDADMQDAQHELDERARSSSPALTEEDLPDRMDSDASEAWWSEDDDESINDAELLEDLPSLQTLADGDFHPFPSRVIFLLHAVASNPRNPLSVTQIRLILQLLKWLGFSDAPSYDKYRKGVQEATSKLSNGAERITEVQGCEEHDFCTTSIATELARDFVNPEARKNMTLYPRADPNIVDLLDGDWAHSLRDSRAAPMVRLPDGRDAFREEPVQLNGGRILLVVAWFQRGGQTHGWGLRCQRDGSAQHILNVVSDREEEFATSAIELVGTDLARMGLTHVIHGDDEQETLNECRKLAAGREVFTIFVRVFVDDLSGAKSKRWDPHYALTFQNGNLSKAYLGRDASMKLFSASPAASAAELMEEFLFDLALLHPGFECLDIQTGRRILLRPTLAIVTCDNPMAAELVSIVGARGNFPCRACRAGGTQESRKTVSGLEAILKPGEPRTARNIKKDLIQQLRHSANGYAAATADSIRATGASDPWTSEACAYLREKHKESGRAKGQMTDELREELRDVIKDKPWAALLDWPRFDPAVNMPLELLHVVLLGFAKYLMRLTITELPDNDKTRLSAWISDADVDGLGLDANVRGGYLIRHGQSLNGKDFRAALQVMPTAMHNLIQRGEYEDKMFDIADAWHAAGRLASLLYVESIRRTELRDYQESLDDAVRFFFWTIANAAPTFLDTKSKLHLLVHAKTQVKQVGPLSALTAEHFESFNAVIRAACLYSNRQKPSRDICTRLLLQQDLRHILVGGRMSDGSTCGSGLQMLLESKTGKLIARMFGATSNKPARSEGSVQRASGAAVYSRFFQDETRASIGDLVHEGSCVKIHRVLARDADPFGTTTDLVFVEDLYAAVGSDVGSARAAVFRATPLWPRDDNADADEDMDRLVCGDSDEQVFLDAKEIVAVINVQHDCVAANCKLQKIRMPRTQRRIHAQTHLKARRALTARRSNGSSNSNNSNNNNNGPRSSNGGNRDADQQLPLPVQANPHAKNFVTAHNLTPDEQRFLRDMVKSYESSPCNVLDQINLPEHSINDQNRDLIPRKRRAVVNVPGQDARHVWEVYLAPMYKVFEFGLLLLSARQTGTGDKKIVDSINSINKQVTKLADKEDKTFNERDVTNLAAQFFYASAVADYSKGEGADMLEKAVMLYLQQHPETLGTSGKEIMKATNTDVQKQIKTILRDKWTNLRYKLKTEIHSSTGEEDGKTPLNAVELLDKLVKSYPVVKTERLLERIAVIRYCILEYHVRLPPPDRMNADENDDDAQDSAGKWSMNDNFWAQAGEFISDCVKMYADPAQRDEVCKLYEDIVAADKERFGDWTFKDRTADRKTEVTINKFIKAAYPDSFRLKKGGRQQEGEAQNGHERNGRKQDAKGGPRDNKRERNGRQQDDEDRPNSEDADFDEDFDEDEDKELPHVKIDTDDEDLYN